MLYNERTNIPSSFEGDLLGPEILELEIEQAVKEIKVGKAKGSDNMSCEMFRTLGQDGLGVLSKLFNQIYNQGVIAEEMCQSVFVPLSKKPGKLLCEEHRTISLMSHLTKVIFKVLGKRIQPKIETELNASQFGLRRDCGARNAVFVPKNFGQRSVEMQKDIYMCFMDYTKAFGRKEHNKMMHSLDNVSLDHKDLRLIQTLYYQQYAAIRVNSKA